jgi:hypothetical protein
MLYFGRRLLMRLFSRISASASERITVVSTRTTCDTIMPMRGLDAVRWK